MRMRISGTNTTSDFRSDHAVRSGMPANLYIREILAENVILWVFFLSNVKFFAPFFALDIFCAPIRIIGLQLSVLTALKLSIHCGWSMGCDNACVIKFAS